MAEFFHHSAILRDTMISEDKRFAPEFELLLYSARTMPDAARVHTLLDAGINWRCFFELAATHSVRLLVYQALRAICWDQLPADFQRDWESGYRSLTAQNLFITGELLRIVKVFEGATIPVAVMKGPVLSQVAYGDFALREFSDLDLLIGENDFSRAIEQLQQLGYTPFWAYESLKVVSFLRHVGEYRLTNQTTRAEVDLHWRVATKATALSPRSSDFSSGFQPVSLAGAPINSFALADLPLYLAAQGGWDQWRDLRRICDVAEFLRRHPEIDWERSLQAARRLGGERSMLVGLALAMDLLGAQIPEPIVRRIRADSLVSELTDTAIQGLQKQNPDSDEALGRYLFQLRAKQGLAGKLALASSIVLDRTAEDGSWIMLPRPLWWLYGILRPLRMSRKIINRSET